LKNNYKVVVQVQCFMPVNSCQEHKTYTVDDRQLSLGGIQKLLRLKEEFITILSVWLEAHHGVVTRLGEPPH